MKELICYFVLLVGVCMSFLYVSFSWRGKSSPGSDFKEDPRVKGLLWGLSGALIIIIADWQRFLQAASDTETISIPRLILLGYYVGGFVIGTIIFLIMSAGSIIAECKRINNRYPHVFLNEGIIPVLDFLIYGYNDYQEKVSKAIDKHKNHSSTSTNNSRITELETSLIEKAEDIDSLSSQLLRRRRLSIEMGEILITAMDLHRGYFSRKLHAPEACRSLLRHAISISAFYTGINAGNINANFMLAEHKSNLSEEDITAAKFMFGDISRYERFLSLKDYAKKGTNIIRLPVEPFDDHNWIDCTLPGAPKAFLSREPTICYKSDVTFGNAVPEAIREAQLKYFATQSFDAIISLPLMASLNYTSPSLPLGVVNIDITLSSDTVDIDEVGGDINELEALLLPCNALLADILCAEPSYARTST
jgi:hypothetical protein